MNRSEWQCVILLAALCLCSCGRSTAPNPASAEWTQQQLQQIESLSIGHLGAPPPAPANPVADDPRAVEFGRKLFFDARLSRNGKIACASCHQPERLFTDGRSTAEGLGQLARNAPSLVGAAWSPWQFWDGRADSLWSQAPVPVENPLEMGATRTGLTHFVAQNYRDDYVAVFGPLPTFADRLSVSASPVGDAAAQSAWRKLSATEQDSVNRVLVNFGRALEAYERTLRPTATRFDQYAEALQHKDPQADARLSAQEREGLKLFLTKGQCLRCHAGPLLTSHGFHNTGLSPLANHSVDQGRGTGVLLLLASPFNCRSPYSSAEDKSCPHLEFIRSSGPELSGAFKAPSLRGLAQTAPYMHDGRFSTLGQVLDHYNRAPVTSRLLGHSEIFPLGLSPDELAALETFLQTLSPVDTPAFAQSGKRE